MAKRSLKRKYGSKKRSLKRSMRRNLRGGNTLAYNILKNYVCNKGYLTEEEFVLLKDQISFYETCRKSYFNQKYPDTPILTFNDYIITNLAYLHGYYIVPYSQINEDHENSVQNLIKLHEFGVFTYNGQGNVCNERERQKPYLSFVLCMFNPEYTKLVVQLINELKRDPRCFIVYYNFNSDEYYDNIQYKKSRTVQYYNESKGLYNKDYNYFPLTNQRNLVDESKTSHLTESQLDFTSKSQYSKQEFKEDVEFNLKFGNYTNLIGFEIFMKEYCDETLADELLLRHMINLDFPLLFPDPFVNAKETIERLKGEEC